MPTPRKGGNPSRLTRIAAQVVPQMRVSRVKVAMTRAGPGRRTGTV
jgi:hypothetical protein